MSGLLFDANDNIHGGKAFLWILVIAILMLVLSVWFGWCNQTTQVINNEFGPKQMLAKYSWFKDAAAELDKKKADIQVYATKFKLLEASYTDIPRNKWPRDDREQWGIWASEVAGIKASYNSLAAEYNAQMVKFNWRFANVGDLPPGATTALPREYKPYIEE
jgi:hypothetical protein